MLNKPPSLRRQARRAAPFPGLCSHNWNTRGHPNLWTARADLSSSQRVNTPSHQSTSDSKMAAGQISQGDTLQCSFFHNARGKRTHDIAFSDRYIFTKPYTRAVSAQVVEMSLASHYFGMSCVMQKNFTLRMQSHTPYPAAPRYCE